MIHLARWNQIGQLAAFDLQDAVHHLFEVALGP